MLTSKIAASEKARVLAHGDKTQWSFTSYCIIKGLCGFLGICRGLVAFFLPTEGRRKDPDEFWSTSRVERSKSDDEEALASQQETQMIFFIQQVA